MFCLLMFSLSSAFFFPLKQEEWPESGPCASYTCNQGTHSTDLLSTCLIYSEKSTSQGNYSVYTGIGCKNKYLRYNFCDLDHLDVNDSSTYNVKCAYPTMNYSTLYPGESPCWDDGNCVSGTCVDYTCTGLKLGSACDFTYQCEPGLGCIYNEQQNKTFCDDLIRPNKEGCVTDFDCVNNAGCDYDSINQIGMCRPYFSIKPGALILKCEDSFSLLCESLQCQEINRQFKCIKPSVSKSLPTLCSTSRDCVDKSKKFYTQCQCGMNKDRKSFCLPFPGDSVSVKLIKSLKKWVASKSILACSSERRWDFNCMRKWEPKLYDRLRYDILHYKNFTAIQDNQECVKEIFTYLYWDAKENMKITSFGKYFVLGLTWVLFG